MSDSERFRRYAADLSTRLTGLEVDRVEGEVVEALRGLVDVLGTDHSTLGELTGDDVGLRLRHTFSRVEADSFVPADTTEARFRWLEAKLAAIEEVLLSRIPEDLPPEASGERAYCERMGLRSLLVVPVVVGGQCGFALATGTVQRYREWKPADGQRLRIVGQTIANALHRKRIETALRRSLEEVRGLKERAEAEASYLRAELAELLYPAEIVGRSPGLRRAVSLMTQVAPSDSTVLLLGETGTGKELFANAIHAQSHRAKGPLVKVNCAAIPATLLESELFGHEKGAFTGAVAARPGRFELADGGTLFLDEIGDLPGEVQAKLLRVLQDHQVQRLGATRSRKVDVRIVSATNCNLEERIAEGSFREDLFYRVAVFVITIPPLRERRDDIPLLVWSIVNRRQAELGRSIEKIPKRAMDALQAYPWPGNVRELENVVERALILSRGPVLELAEAMVTSGGGGPARPGDTSDRLDEVAAKHIVAVLERCDWKINGEGNAAEVLGLHPNTLRSRMRKLGITRPSR